jgi:hypothetical protein
VHGAFGAFIPIGIRIGLDAKERIKAEPRGLTVTYYTGEKAPCPCIADGVMLATNASPGQGTLVIAPEKAPAGMLAVVVVRNRKTGEGFRYTVADAWLPKVIDWNKTLDPAGWRDFQYSWPTAAARPITEPRPGSTGKALRCTTLTGASPANPRALAPALDTSMQRPLT